MKVIAAHYNCIAIISIAARNPSTQIQILDSFFDSLTALSPPSCQSIIFNLDPRQMSQH